MQTLENLQKEKLAEWFSGHKVGPEIFYTSVDLRDSGFKLAPVDTNLFPAGFNNLRPDACVKASTYVREYFESYYPAAKTVALLGENFSRNTFYHENLRALKGIIEGAGLSVTIYMDDAAAATEAGFTHTSYDIKEDVVIVNRDFTAGVPEGLARLKKPVIPNPAFGWHTRRKTHHFDKYAEVATEFANHFGFDPWLITPLHTACGEVDFKSGEGIGCIANRVDEMLAKIAEKYKQYGIDSQPYVYIKSDAGTFGMGIMTVRSGQELGEINKKIRNKMSVIKEGAALTEVILQEGVPTTHTVDSKPAEPFVYLVSGQPVGGIMRINQNRDPYGNLNSAGMEFGPMECAEIKAECKYTPMGIIARLASIAASREVLELAALGNGLVRRSG